jgi:hypothetical protein
MGTAMPRITSPLEITANASFIRGFRYAVELLGSEGDHRNVDWSNAYEFLKGEADRFRQNAAEEISRLRSEIEERREQIKVLERTP